MDTNTHTRDCSAQSTDELADEGVATAVDERTGNLILDDQYPVDAAATVALDAGTTVARSSTNNAGLWANLLQHPIIQQAFVDGVRRQDDFNFREATPFIDVPAGAEVSEIKRRGQPLEADVLLDAVRLHLADAIAIHRGTVHVREDADVDAQLGLSDAAVDANPDEPVDGEPLSRSETPPIESD
mgnify:CR=1 FL=1